MLREKATIFYFSFDLPVDSESPPFILMVVVLLSLIIIIYFYGLPVQNTREFQNTNYSIKRLPQQTACSNLLKLGDLCLDISYDLYTTAPQL